MILSADNPSSFVAGKFRYHGLVRGLHLAKERLNKTMPKVRKTVLIKNKQGLHARPAALFVQIANKFDSTITVRKDKEVVNGKSIMGILMLGAEKGSTIDIYAEGEDAHQAIAELEVIVSQDES